MSQPGRALHPAGLSCSSRGSVCELPIPGALAASPQEEDTESVFSLGWKNRLLQSISLID